MRTEFTLIELRQRMISVARPGFWDRVFKWFITPLLSRPIRELESSLEFERETNQIIGIIDAMTPEERVHPKRIDRPRLIRIANGAGTSIRQVLNVLSMHDAIQCHPNPDGDA